MAKRDASVEFLVGFETEFILLKSTRPIGGAHEHLYAACNGLLTGSVESRILREISDSLIGGGVDVSMYHPEAAPGQVLGLYQCLCLTYTSYSTNSSPVLCRPWKPPTLSSIHARPSSTSLPNMDSEPPLHHASMLICPAVARTPIYPSTPPKATLSPQNAWRLSKNRS